MKTMVRALENARVGHVGWDDESACSALISSGLVGIGGEALVGWSRVSKASWDMWAAGNSFADCS